MRASRDPFSNDPNWSLAASETAATLNFNDGPADPCLPGGSPVLVARYCGEKTTPAGSSISFVTHLVGIIGSTPAATIIDTGIGFNWNSTFNGTIGGIAVLSQPGPVDPGSGSGGITVTNSNGTTDYESGEPNPPTQLVWDQQISITPGTIMYDAATGTYYTDVRIENLSTTKQIHGPVSIVLDSLTEGVSLEDSTGVFGGWPYLAVFPNGLAPHIVAVFHLVFSNPTGGAISFVPLFYSGSL